MDIKAKIIQNVWRSYKMCKIPKLIVKNISKIKNEIDPISSYDLIKSKKILVDLGKLYLLNKNNNYYLYEISSLNLLIESNSSEIFSNQKLIDSEIKEINFYFNLLRNKNEILENNEIEQDFALKTKIFDTFFKLDTYFTLTMYNNVKENDKGKIFTEVKLMWEAFKEDNNVTEMELFGKKLNWIYDSEVSLLTNIDILINNNLEKLFRKNICYIIIGAFSYVDKNIKKIYRNIDFI